MTTTDPSTTAVERVAEFVRQFSIGSGQDPNTVLTVHKDPGAERAPLLIEDLQALLAVCSSTEQRNPDCREVLGHWLDRMDDAEGTIHRNNGTVVLLISGKEIAPPQPVDVPVDAGA